MIDWPPGPVNKWLFWLLTWPPPQPCPHPPTYPHTNLETRRYCYRPPKSCIAHSFTDSEEAPAAIGRCFGQNFSDWNWILWTNWICTNQPGLVMLWPFYLRPVKERRALQMNIFFLKRVILCLCTSLHYFDQWYAPCKTCNLSSVCTNKTQKRN